MNSKVTSRDIQDIISKLSSDKAKTREEGIKLLNTWLEGERSILFCKYLSDKSASVISNEIPHSETWPFMISLLVQCVKLEISSSKRRLPKLSYAKTLRMVVQRAEDSKFAGKNLVLLPVGKLLFNHILDVLKDAPSFQSEYGVILRHLLQLHHYQFHIRKRIYSSLVLFYMEKVETGFDLTTEGHLNPKEEIFRCILTLHCLLENPPGDFPPDLREDVVDGFIRIFSHIKEEGKISRKLVECINTFLLKDGPNLDGRTLKIHDAVHLFVFHCWVTTHDRSLKEALILYARLQLNLTRGFGDGSTLLEQLLEVVCRELDQMSILSTSVSWNDATRDDKCGTLTSSQQSLVELAALVFLRACTSTLKQLSAEKRARREHAAVQIKAGLVEGKWSWHAAFCFLLRHYCNQLRKDLIIFWFESICSNFDRIVNEANVEHAYDGLLWTLRSLQILSSSLLSPLAKLSDPAKSSFSLNELGRLWHSVWSYTIRCLPIFSNVIPVADAALVLLSNIILRVCPNTLTVPQDIWDLRLFNGSPSVSVLHLISCYFSRRVSQVDLRDALHMRKNLLRAVLALLNWKESAFLNEQLVIMVPAAIYALCGGCYPLPEPKLDVAANWVKAGRQEHDVLHGMFELSVEALAKINRESGSEVFQSECYQTVRFLPKTLTDFLCQEVENLILEALKEKELEKMTPIDIFFTCGLLSNLMYCSYTVRSSEENSSFISKLSENIIEMVDHSVRIFEKTRNDVRCGCSASGDIINDMDNIVNSFKIFIGSPLFSQGRKHHNCDTVIYSGISKAIGRLLEGLSKLFDACPDHRSAIPPGVNHSDGSGSNDIHTDPSDNSLDIIVDMELDVNNDPKSMDVTALGQTSTDVLVLTSLNLKMDVIYFISNFFSVLPSMTWDILFDILGKVSIPKVTENILFHLCEYPYWPSHSKVSDMVDTLHTLIDTQAKLRLQCLDIVDAICKLVRKLSLARTIEDESCSSLQGDLSEKVLVSLQNLVNKISETTLFDWHGRCKLIGCICDFMLLNPGIGQPMIEKLFLMLQDSDYRVRICLARRIGVLFQIWDGHYELFQDICSSFGVKLVMSSKGKIVTVKEVLTAGPQSRSLLETTIVTLMHLALESEHIELEAIFMICVIAAIDPCQRELVGAVLDNLSQELQYTTRAKYMEELTGPLLFCWVACGVSLPALVEIRDLFILNAEPRTFMLYCCHWLLASLLLDEDTSNLHWVAKVACQPLSSLVKDHFVHIFAVCMALHCSKRAGWEKGMIVLESSVLSIAEISEDERDVLIKRHMVSIVNRLLSLAAATADPATPFFSSETIIRAIRTVVDGFVEMDDCSSSPRLIDKINIFRPDRVFTFIIEIHYKVAAAAHHRHKCHRLCGVEVLINVIGHRAAVASTFNYLLSLVGQYIGPHALLNQCCRIISMLLKLSKDCQSGGSTIVLGEQLQFLVSKVVGCCMPSNEGLSVASISEVLSLLNQLILQSDTSLHDYIKELEPFPEISIFHDFQKFHQDLCVGYSSKKHLVNLARRSVYLPPRILLWSLKALHKKLFGEVKNGNMGFGDEYWHSDQDIVHSIWQLVRICSLDDANGFPALVSDFVSRIGIVDPHRVVFHFPGDIYKTHGCGADKFNRKTDYSVHMDTAISEEVLNLLLRILKKDLMNDSAKIIDMTTQALRGILSTEKGQRALQSFESHEKLLIEVHSKGVNMELAQKLVSGLELRSSETFSLEHTADWNTQGKTFDMWICPLVYALTSYCNDIILRLCRDLVLVKSEVAELLLPSVMVNLAGRKDLDVDLCKVISLQVEENIFIESNKLTKSIKVMLHALNELRLWHMLERSTSSSSKVVKSSIHVSKPRSATVKSKDEITCKAMATTMFWEKVYWLPIDYLVVAKSAINCGSYFTAVLYVEQWCEDHFNFLTLGSPDFSHLETLPRHIEILISAVTRINEPDSLYGIIQSYKLNSQVIMFEHEGNWTKALEHYDLLVQSGSMEHTKTFHEESQPLGPGMFHKYEDGSLPKTPFKGLIRSLQQIGCTHVLDVYCQGLASRNGQLLQDMEFTELQYEAAWRAGNWDFSIVSDRGCPLLNQSSRSVHFNENLHSCLKALKEGKVDEFQKRLRGSKQELLLSICHASSESTEYLHTSMINLQILYHLGMSWDLHWRRMESESGSVNLSEPIAPSTEQLSLLSKDWSRISEQVQLHMNLLEPLIAFRKVLLQILNCSESKIQHLLQSASILRKGSRFSQAAASLNEFKFVCSELGKEDSNVYWQGRLEEAKLLRAQGQHEMAINLATYVSQNLQFDKFTSDVFRLVGKWLAETRSSNSRTVLEKYLKHAVTLADNLKGVDPKSVAKQCQMHFQLSHYADALYRSSEERLNSKEWQAAMRLRKLKTKELEALIRRLKSSTKGAQSEYSIKIQELQKQLTMDKQEAEKLEEDRDSFLTTALEGYNRCLVIGDKYDLRVVFRLVSLWFGLSSKQIVIDCMLRTIEEVQSYKFIALVYQIASRMGSAKVYQGPHSFQFALASLLKKMAIEHPYHATFQLLALANGDRIKDKQRSRNSFVVDMDKKVAAESLLKELQLYHGAVIIQMKQMVEIYIKLAELETKREDTNKRVTLPRDIRSVRELELVSAVFCRKCRLIIVGSTYITKLGLKYRPACSITTSIMISCLLNRIFLIFPWKSLLIMEL
ncbi:OLC1v1005280C2 [Oldenlandia corymbosa var. corymbosa]|uniref:OLC1v1005280C2 n=1 Tax=Oldenlandia corymbosa var. corymbosa TaxID=529605 RepID=A0AAV1DEA4_OLDCO|nr:OLC1v1005280C2 [Oldenlandia corymbosa var. corymbosa]